MEGKAGKTLKKSATESDSPCSAAGSFNGGKRKSCLKGPEKALSGQLSEFADLLKSENNYGILRIAEAAAAIFVGSFVIDPVRTIQYITELVFTTCLKIEGDRE